jgi:chromosome segregation ATPase
VSDELNTALALLPWAAWGAKELIVRYVRRVDAHEDKEQATTTGKLDQVLSKVGILESDMRLLLEKLSTAAGQVAEVRARVEGLSANYGPRISNTETALVELRTRAASADSVLSELRTRLQELEARRRTTR